MTRGVATALWTLLAFVGLLWPARAVGPLDGAPLDHPAEAALIGVVAPSLWWLGRAYLSTPWARGAIVALLAWKLGLSVTATQQGLCAVTTTPAPLAGTIQTIPIDEPGGVLRSWDVRADWRAASPRCTAILARALPSQAAFPAWFLNLVDYLEDSRDVRMAVSGYVTTAAPHALTIATGRDVLIDGRVGAAPFTGAPVALQAGTHEVELQLRLTGNDWRFEPRLDGVAAWDAALVTTGAPRALDRLIGRWASIVTAALVLLLLAGWLAWIARTWRPDPILGGWVVVASAAAVALALQPVEGLRRAAGLVGVLSVALPLAARARNLRGAFLLVGAPWLAFFVAWSLGRIGHVTPYSADDWLTYQVAGYRIFMHGYWLEGGTAVFDYQPLYRWMTGALHLVFGDSSVGEVYWDAACLLMGALLAFQLVRSVAGFRWALLAASATLGTFTLGTIWYFTGRGLSEIAAAGWAFLAMFFLLRARLGGPTWAAAAAAAAVLMFYTRLNHLLFAAFLPALLLPLRTPARWTDVVRVLSRVRRVPAAIFAAGFAAGVGLFVLRTWSYTGVLGLFHGTSLRHNDTGLRPWTILDGEVWASVGHSVAGLLLMNEPPAPDPRALVVAAGALVAVAALLQLPVARRQPAAVVGACLGAGVGSLFAHTHNYPGRLSIHLVPLAAALAVTTTAALARPRARRVAGLGRTGEAAIRA